MVVRTYLFEFRGGLLLQEIEPLDVSYQQQLNTSEEVVATVDLRSVSGGSRDWRNLATAWKHGLAVDVDGRLYGGPIMPHDMDDDDGKLSITARGIRTHLAHRKVLSLRALTTPLTLPTGMPNTSLDTVLDGFDLGTIAKRLVQQAYQWPGCTDIPISYEADRFGSRRREYAAIDLKNLDEALDDLSSVQNGPDLRFELGWRGADAFGWMMSSGTESQPQLFSPDVFAWEIGQGSGLRVQLDPSQMGSVSWAQGGRSDDVALVRMRYEKDLIDRGYPMLELDSDASTNTVLPETLDEWNAAKLRTAKVPVEFWSFKIRTDREPFPSEYAVGDYVDVIVTADTPVSGGYVPPGTYRRRIVGISGGLDDFAEITCGEVYGDG